MRSGWIPQAAASSASGGAATALATVLLAGIPLFALAFAISATLDPGAAWYWRVAAAYLFTGACIVGFAARWLAPARFGVANQVTAARAMLTALIAGFIGAPGTPAVAWVAIGIAIAILLLDGVDGRLARARGEANAFGARFDMETDAALTLVLAVVCWQFGKAGIWILAVGLMRYAFVAAATFAPWMRRPLPASRRRQTICVVQMSGLLAVLSPLFPVPASSLIGVATAFMLAISFAIDIGWLAQRRSAMVRQA